VRINRHFSVPLWQTICYGVLNIKLKDITMKKIMLAMALVIAVGFQGKAQDYDTGIGLRAGSFSGLTVKHFLSQSHAVEGILSSRWEGIDLAGLYEYHQPAFNTPGLNWYCGVGAHIGFWDGDHSHWDYDDDNRAILGINGIIGIEYNFAEAPINLSIDWMPVLNITDKDGDDFWADGIALSIRYIF
ncbi:MAG: hypothetical protein AB7D05_01900, partial [Mangrovibacterium sp.]